MKKKYFLSAILFFMMMFITLQTVSAQTPGIARSGSSKPAPTTSGNGWSGASAISPVCQPDPTRGAQLNDVAVNASGLTIAAWDQFTYNGSGGATIGAAIQSGGRWGAPFTISGTSGFSQSPKVAVGTDGTMAVSWVYQDPIAQPLAQYKIQVAVKPAGATIWTTTTLAQGDIGGVSTTAIVPVAVDPNGNVTAAWTYWNGSIHLVQSASLPKGGVWSAPVNLAPGVDGLYLALAMNARGDAAVAFTISPYTSYLTGTYAQYVFRSGPNGAWTTPVTVSETLSSSVGYVKGPMVALDANGLATVAYFAYGVEAVRQQTGGSWSSPVTVLQASNSVSSYISPDLAMDNAGNALVAVSIFDATVGVDRASVWVATRTPAGTWTPQKRITDPTVPVDAYATRAAVSPDGALAMVGWIDHYHGTVQVSKLSGGVWGAANTIGKGTAFSSFQEILGLDAASGTVARAVWKNTKTGTQTMAASYDLPNPRTQSLAMKTLTTLESAPAEEVSAAIIPNPNNGNFNVNLHLPESKESTMLELYNNSGVKVWQENLGTVSGVINKNVYLENKLSPGVYLLVIQRKDVRYKTKIVISK